MADPLLVEIGYGNGDWANISDRIRTDAEITITRGRQGEDGIAPPSGISLTVDNQDGTFDVRDPTSLLYGLLGRNSLLRVSYGRGKLGMVTPNLNGRAQCEDTAALSFTGDLDLRVDLELLSGDWATAGDDIANHFDNIVGYCRWTFYLVGGKPRFTWFPTGTYPTGVRTATASVALPAGVGRKALRVTLDVDNGASGATVRFYTAATIAGPWVQLGTDVTSAGVTSLFDTPGSLRVGAANDATIHTWGSTPDAVFYSMELRSGIGGTVVASPDFTTQPLDPVPFASSEFTDAQGNDWTFIGVSDAARIWYGDVDIRGVGEIAELPKRFSLDLNNRWVPIAANGMLRRLDQGKSPAKSGISEYILSTPGSLAAYYPLDGQEGTTYSLNLAPDNRYLSTRFEGVADPSPPVFTYGVEMGRVGTGMELNATGDVSYMRGQVVTPDENVAFDMVFHSPRGFGVLTMEIEDYSFNQFWLVLNTELSGGTAQVSFNDYFFGSGPVAYPETAVIPELLDGQLHHVRFAIQTTSPYNSTYRVYIDGVQVDTGAFTNQPWGVKDVKLRYTRYVNQTVTNIAHIAVWANASNSAIPAVSDAAAATFGYAGETAAARLERVAADGSIPLEIVGDPNETTEMGPLFAEPRVAQMRDAEATDLGILHDSRTRTGLLYRTRRSMTGQDPVLELALSQVVAPLDPIDDDQLTRNDVTATRREGGSYRVVVSTGRLSVQDPPNGVGLYDDEVVVNPVTDSMLIGIASWLANRGTQDKARYPSVPIDLASPMIDLATETAAYLLDVGDALVLTAASAIGEYDDIPLIMVGYTETIGIVNQDGKRLSRFTWTCIPGDLWKAARYGTARYDTGGSTLASSATSTATTLSLATATGKALWTTDDAAFPFDLWVAGERVTVTDITGASSPQTATVVRSVNGVVKSQAAGATVRLFDTPRYALGRS